MSDAWLAPMLVVGRTLSGPRAELVPDRVVQAARFIRQAIEALASESGLATALHQWHSSYWRHCRATCARPNVQTCTMSPKRIALIALIAASPNQQRWGALA